MDTKKLYALCGIDQIPAPPKIPWSKAKLSFLGAERYVLGTKEVEARLMSIPDGFQLQFKVKLGVKGEALMGKHCREVRVLDVLVEFPGTPGLYLANMHKEQYPRVLRDQDILRLN